MARRARPAGRAPASSPMSRASSTSALLVALLALLWPRSSAPRGAAPRWRSWPWALAGSALSRRRSTTATSWHGRRRRWPRSRAARRRAPRAIPCSRSGPWPTPHARLLRRRVPAAGAGRAARRCCGAGLARQRSLLAAWLARPTALLLLGRAKVPDVFLHGHETLLVTPLVCLAAGAGALAALAAARRPPAWSRPAAPALVFLAVQGLSWPVAGVADQLGNARLRPGPHARRTDLVNSRPRDCR